ncbi:glycerophosphoryl diester phosphodiesterase [Diaminobutyricimonas aerilata]|uniref:glycerophosphodiester phosphodiesterase n=1 Tax=Diaminobutyricimonas aerilata TaxID=1162967 RepID=A0A2M9CMN2_9MICO|nr:glycerophosphodiester phosphodiesterase family protein [Diaminobutyricimonas aerilata]PJJ73142.1 glycerophosphoryl diester phosphodiesterase [Diaminobutyricimonas aerilata]
MSSQPHPLVIAHRGASGYRPEHTRAAYELAVALGADAIEPDIVATRDGVLVLRHENEISGTTDVARRTEFADRRTTKTIDGRRITGWFTEDFTWDELRTLRAVERLPKLRRTSATFDGRYGVLRLRDLMEILDDGADRLRRQVAMVAEIKHATYFSSIGLPLDELFAAEVEGWATDDNLIVESFEQTVLGRIRERGVTGRYVYLVESQGAPPDLVSAHGARARSYAAHLTDSGLQKLAGEVDGVSVSRSLVLRTDAAGNLTGTTDVIERARSAGLSTFVWTFRGENQFLPRNLRIGSRPGRIGDWAAAYRALAETGVDGIFADQPDLAVAARDEG